MNLRSSLGSALLCVALVVPAGARAESPAPSPPVQGTELELARSKFEAGAEAYRAGRYHEAIEAFLAADALAPRPALSFNVARAYDELGDAERALEHYRTYLERDPDGETASETRTRIAELEAALSAQAARKPGHAAPAAETSEAAEPAPSPANARPAPERALRPSESKDDALAERSLGVWPWIALGAGGAALATSLGFELARRSAEHDAEAASHAEFSSNYDRMERRKVSARVFAGLGGALLVAGGVLVYLDRRTQASVALDCGPGHCAGRWEHRF